MTLYYLLIALFALLAVGGSYRYLSVRPVTRVQDTPMLTTGHARYHSRECVRRRKQIASGHLTTANGLQS